MTQFLPGNPGRLSIHLTAMRLERRDILGKTACRCHTAKAAASIRNGLHPFSLPFQGCRLIGDSGKIHTRTGERRQEFFKSFP